MAFPYGIDLSTDWHCHLLPGFDDGPDTLEESLEMARHLAASGVTTVHCTPHCIKGSFEYTPGEVMSAVTRLQEELERAAIGIALRPGMEYLLDEFFPARLASPLPLGETNLLLVESYPSLPLSHLRECVFTIIRAGFRPLLAHPERNALLAPPDADKGNLLRRLSFKPVTRDTEPLNDLRDMGCLFQGNLGSFTGYYGRNVESVARINQDSRLYHCYGSDAHSLAHCRAMLAQ